MREIEKTLQSKQFVNEEHAKIWRVIGTTDIDGNGVHHGVADIDPIIFLDEAILMPKIQPSFKKHPHTGLAAITYLLEGEAYAWDNLNGDTQDLNRAGGVYFINAGKGVVHGESPNAVCHKIHLLQLWINPDIYQDPLPDAHYQLFQPEDLPVFNNDKFSVRIVVGEAFERTSPVKSPWPLQYLHVQLKSHEQMNLDLPCANWQGFIYVLQGEGQFGANSVNATKGDLAKFSSKPDTKVWVKNSGDEVLNFVMVSGEPHNKPFYKLLGHGGALIADKEEKARSWMKNYEADKENFGK